jgi:hypothetical protein
MEINIQIPSYAAKDGLVYHWESGFQINVINENNEIKITANKAGLVSLAIQLLTLAQDSVPVNSHFHYDEYNSLESNAKELVIQKIEAQG